MKSAQHAKKRAPKMKICTALIMLDHEIEWRIPYGAIDCNCPIHQRSKNDLAELREARRVWGLVLSGEHATIKTPEEDRDDARVEFRNLVAILDRDGGQAQVEETFSQTVRRANRVLVDLIHSLDELKRKFQPCPCLPGAACNYSCPCANRFMSGVCHRCRYVGGESK